MLEDEMRDSNKNQPHSWLKGASTNSEDVEVYYDVWAKKYNEDLTNWQYHAPIEAANLAEAIAKFPAAVNEAVERLMEEAREMQRREASRIVVPGDVPILGGAQGRGGGGFDR